MALLSRRTLACAVCVLVAMSAVPFCAGLLSHHAYPHSMPVVPLRLAC